ncbi:uncharacterized protein OCT59_017201 [Rhizophagus irregularis]|uniref:uncharacterized protein n=1 Tax=Rhizophagus irregularis TaxID=588596 RepID=UPI00332231DD|nr:hypothetical protein OCT59_017201 [Rhizophagus irregularis]
MASEIDLLRQENARLMADEFKAKYNEAKDSLDVCLEKIIRSCDPLAVKMGTPTFSHLYEKLCDAVILVNRVT